MEKVNLSEKLALFSVEMVSLPPSPGNRCTYPSGCPVSSEL